MNTVNGRELKKGDCIEYQIMRLAGVDYNPPIIHRGTVFNPDAKTMKDTWVVQIKAERFNPALPNYDFSTDIRAIYGDDIINII